MTAPTPVNVRDVALQAAPSRSIETVLNKEEKPYFISLYEQILSNKIVLNAQAATNGVVTENTNYNAAITALTAYLATITLPVLWNDITNVTKVVRATFTSKFTDVETNRKLLVTAINTAINAKVVAAQADADAAQIDADAATTLLANIANDNMLTPSEKHSIRLEWNIVISEKAGLNSTSALYASTSAENTTYNNAIQALGTYLNNAVAYTLSTTVPPTWINDASLGTNTVIVGSTFRANWKTLYDARQALLNDIAIEAGKVALWSNISGQTNAPEDNATVGANATNLLIQMGGDNLIANSGFEEQLAGIPYGFTAYNNAGGALIYPTVAGRLGGKAFAVRANHALAASGSNTLGFKTYSTTVGGGYTGGVRGLWQPLKKYVVSFKAKKINAAAWTTPTLRWNIAPASVSSAGNPSLSTVWQTFTFRIIMGASVETLGGVILDVCNFAAIAVNDEVHFDELIIQEGDFGTEWFASTSDATVAADAAMTAALDAQGDATIANNLLADIANDNLLTASEKQSIRLEWNAVISEKAGLNTTSGLYVNTSAENTAYNNAIQALGTYLNNAVAYTLSTSVPPTWINDANLSSNTTIVGSTFRANWKTLYDTRQALLNDIAVEAGKVALWAGVDGPGRPADNAGSDTTLVASSNINMIGNSATKTTATGAWDAQVYSLDSYTGGAYAACRIVTAAFMLALDSNPTENATYSNLDYAIYPSLIGTTNNDLYIYENGVSRGVFGTWAVGDILAVTYDGSNVRYLKNGVVLRPPTSVAANLKLYLDTSFLTVNSSVTNLRFGPMSSNQWADVGGSAAVDATIQAAADAASDAQIDATAANTLLAAIANDNLLTPSEKHAVRLEWNAAISEKAGINATSALYANTSAENTAYNNAIQALGTYLNNAVAYTLSTTVPPTWINDASLSSNTTIVGATFRANWKTLYDTRQALLNDIAVESGKVALWSNISGQTDAPQDNATVGADATNLVVQMGGDNLLANSGMEEQASGTPYGWTPYNAAGVTVTYPVVAGRLGGKSFTMRASSALVNAGSNTFGIRTASTLTGGGYVGGVKGGWQPLKKYVISFKAKRVNAAGWTGPNLRWNTAPASVSGVGNPVLSTAWQKFVFRVTIGASAETLGNLYIDFCNLTNIAINDEISIDEIIVQEGDVGTEWFPSASDSVVVADAAAAAALSAQNSATTANNLLADIANDNLLTPSEKHSIRLEWNAVISEKAGLNTTSGLYANTSAENTAYNNAIQALGTYLNNAVAYTLSTSVPPIWVNDANLSTSTVIVGSTFRANWKTLYDARQALLNDISVEAGKVAVWATVSGTGKPADNATVGAAIGTNLSGQFTSANSATFIATAAIKSAQIEYLQTSNYTEDGSGNATAGARISSTATDAIRVSNGGLKIGTVYFTDYWARLVQGIDGNVTSAIIWRGNNDVTTRGGAPNIACLNVYTYGSAGGGSGFQQVYFRTKLTPTSYTSYTDNLDAMTQLHVQFFVSTGSSSPFTESYFPMASRTYDAATGASEGSFHWAWRSPAPMLESGSPYQYSGVMRVRIANTYGWSATKDLGAVNTLGALLTPVTITGSSGSSGGGGGGAGGICPAPWVDIRLESGLSIPASQLYNGARLRAVNDTTLEPIKGGGVVQNLSTIWNTRYRVTLTNGKFSEWSKGHRFAILDRGWVEIEKLLPGDHIIGLEESIVSRIVCTGEGQVVSFTVKGAGTYFGAELLSHNIKEGSPP
jgi:hypothetical protein